MTLKASTSVTSLRDLAAGRMPCGSPESVTISTSGQAARLASHSALSGTSAGKVMIGTSPLCSSNSSKSVDLQLRLASRLLLRLPKVGSTIYSLTWRMKDTPAGRQYCQLVASGHRTNANGCFLVRTAWPTPTASDYKGSGPTVIRKDGKNRTFDRLVYAAEQGITESIRFTDRGKVLTGSDVPTANGVRLNPEFSRWLMGYPAGWGSCRDTVTPSSRKSQPNS